MNYSEEQICLAALSLTGTNKPAEMTCKKKDENHYVVSYTRQEDLKEFSYLCKIEGDEVRWFHEDIGGWNDGNRVYFNEFEGRLILQDYSHGELIKTKDFTKSDFSI